MSVSIYIGAGAEDDLNLANGNFVRVMHLIDEPVDPANLCGVWEGPALAALAVKVRFALDSIRAMPSVDDGTPAIASRIHGHMAVIDCGLRDGYFADRLSRLMAVIEEALEAGVPLHYA